MTRQGLFATGSAVEIAAVPLGDGVELRVGRATDSYHKVPKGELFVEAFRNDSFVMHAPLKSGTAIAQFLPGRIDESHTHLVDPLGSLDALF